VSEGLIARRWSRRTGTSRQRQDRVPRRWTGLSGWRLARSPSNNRSIAASHAARRTMKRRLARV